MIDSSVTTQPCEGDSLYQLYPVNRLSLFGEKVERKGKGKAAGSQAISTVKFNQGHNLKHLCSLYLLEPPVSQYNNMGTRVDVLSTFHAGFLCHIQHRA